MKKLLRKLFAKPLRFLYNRKRKRIDAYKNDYRAMNQKQRDYWWKRIEFLAASSFFRDQDLIDQCIATAEVLEEPKKATYH